MYGKHKQVRITNINLIKCVYNANVVLQKCLKIEKEFGEILIISNNKSYNFKNKKIYTIKDCIEGQLGPLAGILTAMKWVKENKKNYRWIASFPCDTPFF